MVKEIQQPLYYDYGLISRLSTAGSQKEAAGVFYEYLQRGAHPAYIKELLQSPISSTLPNKFNYLSIAQREFRKFANFPSMRMPQKVQVDMGQAVGGRFQTAELYPHVPSSSSSDIGAGVGSQKQDVELDLELALLYNGATAITPMHEGVLHAVCIRVMDVLKESIRATPGEPLLHKRLSLKAFSKLANHPDANIRFVGELEHRLQSVAVAIGMLKQSMGLAGLGSFKPDAFLSRLELEKFLAEQIRLKGLESVLRDILELWVDEDSVRVWYLLMGAIGQIHALPGSFNGISLTDCIKTLLRIAADKKGAASYGATRVLNLYKWSDPFTINYSAKLILAVVLSKELPGLAAAHTMIKWLSFVPPAVRRILMSIWISPLTAEARADETIIQRTREIFSAIFSSDISDWMDEAHEETAGVEMPAKVPQLPGPPGFVMGFFVQMSDDELPVELLNLDPRRHNCELAEALDSHLSLHEATESETQSVIEETLDILCGEVAETVTTLPPAPLLLPRRSDEFLGIAVPKIWLGQHPLFGDDGAACVFELRVPGFPDLVRGELDPEGNLSVRYTSWLSDSSRQKLKAVVLKSVAAVLTPEYVNLKPTQLRVRTQKAEPRGYEPELNRPVINTHSVATESSGVPNNQPSPPVVESRPRFNLGVVEKILVWLLEDDPRPAVLFEFSKFVLDNGGAEWTYHRSLSSKAKLLSGELTLKDLFIQVRRPKAFPLSYRFRNGKVVPFNRSEKADRNLKRYRMEGGRRKFKLDDFLKMIDLPNGPSEEHMMHMSFDRGAYLSLWEILKWIDDRKGRDLKRQTLQKFKLG